MSYRLSDPTQLTDLLTSANRVGLRTFTEVPLEVFAVSSRMAGRRRAVLHNLSTDTRLRVGVATANLQRDGQAIEPGERGVLTFDTAVALVVYACSEGAPVIAQVEEN